MAVNFRRLTPADLKDPSLNKLNEELRQTITELNRLGGYNGVIALVAPIDMGGNTIQNLNPSPTEGEQDAVGRAFADQTYSTSKTIQQIATQLGLTVSGAVGSGVGTAPGTVTGAANGSVLFIVAGVIKGDAAHLFWDSVNHILQITGEIETTSLAVSGNIGFFGTAPTTKPTVTGSKGGNAALASLMTALAGLGLVVDSTT